MRFAASRVFRSARAFSDAFSLRAGAVVAGLAARWGAAARSTVGVTFLAAGFVTRTVRRVSRSARETSAVARSAT